jgi:hypothetical protein
MKTTDIKKKSLRLLATSAVTLGLGSAGFACVNSVTVNCCGQSYVGNIPSGYCCNGVTTSCNGCSPAGSGTSCTKTQ